LFFRVGENMGVKMAEDCYAEKVFSQRDRRLLGKCWFRQIKRGFCTNIIEDS